jgi:cytochrome c oxidase assembly factor CtaG
MLGLFARMVAAVAGRSAIASKALTSGGRWLLTSLGFATVFDAAVDVATTPGATVIANAPPADEVRRDAKQTVYTLGAVVYLTGAFLFYWFFIRSKKRK